MEKVADIIESIANEKDLDIEDVKQKVKIAFIQSAKELFGNEFSYECQIDQNSKNIKLFQKILVVKDDDERLQNDNVHFISLSKAKEIDKFVEVGDEINYEINLEDLGRSASNILSRELNYHIQRLLEEKILKNYTKKIGEIVFGNVIQVDAEETTYIDFDNLKAFMPMKSRIKGEKFKVGDGIRAVIKKVFIDKNQGIKIELSRTSPKFLEGLLNLAVPEIKDKNVLIISCARIPGERAKVALEAIKNNIDPVGACVGTKGIRINSVSKELNGENIDAIEYSNQPEIFISRAMAPAIVNSVKIEDKKAFVYINQDQKSKAIGKNGLNIRLASMLCGYEIELVENKKDSELKNENGLKNLQALFGEI